MSDTVVVRLGGEIGIKAEWTRKLYERRLTSNIRAVLKHYGVSNARVLRSFGRLYIKTNQSEETVEKLSKVFGISSLSPAVETSSNLDDIVNVCVLLAGLEFKKANSFAVRCHRVGKHPYTSQDVCRQVGTQVLASHPKLSLSVDLTRPDQVLGVEVREDKSYVFINCIKGSDGFPLGTQPKTVSLLKGDVKSIVASWMVMKRGCPTILVYFKTDRSASEAGVQNAVRAAHSLMEWSIGFPRNLYVIELSRNFHRVIQRKPPEVRSLLCKRVMLYVAKRIAEMKNAEGIVTGDSLGEEKTHSLHGFRLQDEAARGYPIYRPVVGLDCHELDGVARRIGLEETSCEEERPKAETGRGKIAAIKLRAIKRREKEIGIEKTVDEALKSLTVIRI